MQEVNHSRGGSGAYNGVGYAAQMDEKVVKKEFEDLHGARASKELGAESDASKFINYGYFLQLMVVSWLGIMQFGLSISAWNVQASCFKLLYAKENEKEEYDGQSTDNIQIITTIGMVIGSFAAGPLSKYGRWLGVILMGIISLVGGGLSLAYSNYWMVFIGKALTGLAAGGYNVFCPKFIMECAPKEINGPAGASFQLAVTFGILINAIVALPYGDLDMTKDKDQLLFLYFFIQLLPMAFALMQILLMCTCYRTDTPVVMIQNNQGEAARIFLNKLYSDEQIVDERFSELQEQNAGSGEEEGASISYGQAFCSPQYSRATFVSIVLAICQQLTGINVVMFYSSKIFAPKPGDDPSEQHMSGVMVNFWVYFTNFAAVVVVIGLLSRFGRKTLMTVFTTGQAVVLVGLGIFLLQENKELCLIATLLFLVFFELSSGPIIWLYIAEISCDKAASAATVMNQIINLLAAIVPAQVSPDSKPNDEGIAYLFIGFGGITALSVLFICVFMKETRNKTQAEIEAMFAGKDSGYRPQDNDDGY